MKKFAGSDLSLRLLYDKSRTSREGKDPNPRGREFSLLTPRFRTLSFDSEDKVAGTSVKRLLNRFRISRLPRFPMLSGRAILGYESYINKLYCMVSKQNCHLHSHLILL